MAVIYFDTSALVRRYTISEPGSSTVRALCHRRQGNDLLIGEITAIEVASALSRMVRERRIRVPHRDRSWRLFRRHARLRYRVVVASQPVHILAQRLLFTHPLRAFDALHLASALHARRSLTRMGADFLFCTADQNQASAATAEGLTVELIR